ncbi:uncharacterized protein EI97DRAFT_439460 [Westerdykella ornata]|uniref:Uncharacterized protein n=1 Tax=Westerdykella ornata TaxID=318751 RepID=A0A6A6JXI5_WESOR|nr:uncharacterized protein EI97DRAFT_439460 [Westerdykella ornata]KAF2280446.1 hypothetical protein EI97DRAFT_439460 [Westerdykella ornata]
MSLGTLFAFTEKEVLVPSVSSLIQAADEEMYGSALFRAVHCHATCCSTIESILDAFAEALKGQPFAERIRYTSQVRQYVSSRKHHRSGRHSSGGTNERLSIVSLPKHPLDILERVFGNARCKRMRHEPKLAPIQITVTSSELVAFSLFLATPLVAGWSRNNQDRQETVQISEPGAVGISFQTSPSADGIRRMHLQRRVQDLSEKAPLLSSGYSSYFSKVLACGCLPLSKSGHSTEIIYISSNVARAICLGKPVMLLPSIRVLSMARPIQFLMRLPRGRTPLVHVLASSSPNPSSHLPDDLLSCLSILALTHPPPMASNALISTITFIASGGLPPGRLLQRLESVVGKVHRYSTSHAGLFGEMYRDTQIRELTREHLRLGKFGIDSETREAHDAAGADTMGRKAARVARWNLALQRLMGMLVERGRYKRDEAVSAVKSLLKVQFEESYRAALRAREIRVPENPKSKRRTDMPTLARQVEEILKMELPLDIDALATLARLMLVGWCYSVVGVAWEDGEEGVRLEIPKEEHEMVLM